MSSAYVIIPMPLGPQPELLVRLMLPVDFLAGRLDMDEWRWWPEMEDAFITVGEGVRIGRGLRETLGLDANPHFRYLLTRDRLGFPV